MFSWFFRNDCKDNYVQMNGILSAIFESLILGLSGPFDFFFPFFFQNPING